MNFFQRLLRLPFVMKGNPFVVGSVWAAIAVAHFRSNITNTRHLIPADDPVKAFNIFSIADHLIKKFNDNRAPSIAKYRWVLSTGLSFFRFIINNYNNNPSNQIIDHGMPSIIAGKINSNHIVHNMQGKTFIIALSEEVVNYIGFTLIIFRSILFFLGLVVFIRYLLRQYNKFLNNRSNNVIDVESRDINNSYIRPTTYLSKYRNK